MNFIIVWNLAVRYNMQLLRLPCIIKVQDRQNIKSSISLPFKYLDKHNEMFRIYWYQTRQFNKYLFSMSLPVDKIYYFDGIVVYEKDILQNKH